MQASPPFAGPLLCRLIILGDPHITEDAADLWRHEIIPDLNALGADRVLVLGDLTGEGWMGTTRGSAAAAVLLNGLAAPWHSIIGNHDLQCQDFASDEAALAMMLKVVGREKPGFTVELPEEQGGLAIIGLDNTQFRPSPQEIVIDDAQLAWWETELERLAGRPVLVLCHTPPVGSGLIMMAEIHAGGNAYTNQNHHPGRLQRIIREHPNVLLWFSGHNHLGQQYRNAATRKLGVTYFHTATAAPGSTRDGMRQSRVLDVYADGWIVRTFDHALREFDDALEFREECPLPELLAYRTQQLGARFVPVDPDTTYQGTGVNARLPGVTRIAFLSDAHCAKPLPEVQRRILAWGARELRRFAPDHLLLGGDITHQANPAQARVFLENLAIRDIPITYIPGNNEGRELDLGESGPALVRECTAWPEAGERVFLLPTADREQAAEAVRELLERLPRDGAALVFAHFPPEEAGAMLVNALAEQPVVIHWVCGHRHTPQSREQGNLRVRICGGLDPVKVRGVTGELLLVDWDGANVAFHSLQPPREFISPRRHAERPFPIGLAFRGPAEEILATGLKYQVPALQFHYRHSQGTAAAKELDLAAEYRRAVPDSFLSLHLPNFPHPAEGPNLADLQPWIQWAGAMKVDDWTIHLPDVSASYLFGEDGRLLETPWAKACMMTYVRLASLAVANGANISFENVYNKLVTSEPEERLGSRPWHITRFIEVVRVGMMTLGIPLEGAFRAGAIFDAGHAFADVKIAKWHGLANWVHELAPYAQLSHIHQVVQFPDGSRKNHQAIAGPVGPLINFTGLMSVLKDAPCRPFPLLIEVREREAALASLETLRGL